MCYIVALNVKCLVPFKECVEKLLSDVSEEAVVSCFISDALCYFTQAVADNLQLPRIVLRTGGVSSFVAFAAFPILRQKGYLPIQGYLLSNSLFNFRACEHLLSLLILPTENYTEER